MFSLEKQHKPYCPHEVIYFYNHFFFIQDTEKDKDKTSIVQSYTYTMGVKANAMSDGYSFMVHLLLY